MYRRIRAAVALARATGIALRGFHSNRSSSTPINTEESGAANVAAIALYEACGFTTFGKEIDYMIVDGVGQDELHMVCTRDTLVRR